MEQPRDRSANDYARDLERQLDAVLPAVGYHCLHACAWPGTDRANLDHVVIGPGGVFVIDDKYLSHEVRRGTDGRVWSGGHPLDPEIDQALAQASAVGDLLGTSVTAVLALHGSHVAAMPVVRGAHLFAAGDVPAFLQRRPRHRSPGAVANVAGKANSVLRPERSTPAASPRVPPGSIQPSLGESRPHPAGAENRNATRRRLLAFTVAIVVMALALGLAYVWF